MTIAAVASSLGLMLAWSLAGAGELADRIQDRDRNAAIALIESGADVNEAQGDGTTPLHWAVYHVDPELTAMLLAQGADPDVTNNYGSSPLGEAASVASVELVSMLLEAGSDPDMPNADGQTVLMLASRSGSLEIVRLLLEHGADANARESWRGQSALIWAADSRFPEIVDALIAAGADVDFRAESQDWPSQITSEPRAQYRPVGGLTPLLYAARSGCTACVASILDAGADIDRPTPEGMTPLIVAIDNGAFDTAQLLLDRGANPHLWDWYGRTALYVAVDMTSYLRGGRVLGGVAEARPVSAEEIIEALLDAGVDPNAQLNMHRPGRGGNMGRFTDDLLTTGATPLLRAVVAQSLPVMSTLIESGALVDLPNVQGVTPLLAAAGIARNSRGCRIDGGGDSEARAIEMLDLLLESGASIDVAIEAEYNRSAVIARVSSMTNREGQTPLHAAVCLGWYETAEFLLDNGAAIDATDSAGNTPLDLALTLLAEAEQAGDQNDHIILATDLVTMLRSWLPAED